MKATELPKEKLEALLDNAQTALDTAASLLDVGDFGEEDFKTLCAVATRAVIIKAAITSMESFK